MAFRKTLKKNRYSKKTAKKRTWKGGVAPPTKPNANSISPFSLSPIRSIGSPIRLSDSDISFSLTPPSSPNRPRSTRSARRSTRSRSPRRS